MEIQELKEYFKNDRFIERLGIEILSVNEKSAVVGAAILPHHLNANDVVQGGMLYTLADFAFAVLANNLHPQAVSQVGQISYLAAAKTGYVTAEATEIAKIGHNCICQVIIKSGEGQLLCTATFNGFIKNDIVGGRK